MDWAQRKTTAIRAKCRRLHIEFDLTPSVLRQLWIRQGGKCPLTGHKMLFNELSSPYSVSVDRLDSQGGYVPGNVRLVTRQANCARHEWGDHQLLEFCKSVVRYAHASVIDR